MKRKSRLLAARDDWTRLAGAVVEIRLKERLVRIGRVEQVTPDSSMLWIEADAVEPRILFDKNLGYRVRPHFADAPGSFVRCVG